jgi:hypothetical protein
LKAKAFIPYYLLHSEFGIAVALVQELPSRKIWCILMGIRLFSFLCGREKNRGNFPEIYSSKPCLARLLGTINTDYHTQSGRAGILSGPTLNLKKLKA